MSTIWYECKIKYRKTDETGGQKITTEPYLVDALSYTEAEKRINEFFDTIIESCLTEGFVQITGYGTFEYKYTEEREATNPKTGEKVVVAPKSSIRFKPGKKMKDF